MYGTPSWLFGILRPCQWIDACSAGRGKSFLKRVLRRWPSFMRTIGNSRAFLKRPQRQRLAVETRQRRRPFGEIERDTLGSRRDRMADQLACHIACARRKARQCKRRRGATGEHRGAGQKLSTCQHKSASTTDRSSKQLRMHGNAQITSPSQPHPAYRDCPSLRP